MPNVMNASGGDVFVHSAKPKSVTRRAGEPTSTYIHVNRVIMTVQIEGSIVCN